MSVENYIFDFHKELEDEINKYYKNASQMILEEERQIVQESKSDKLTYETLKKSTKGLNEVKQEQKKSEHFFIEHAKLLKKTLMLEKFSGIHCTINRVEEYPNTFKVQFSFENKFNLKFLYELESARFSLNDMTPKHKNFENIKNVLKETQDIQGFIVRFQENILKLQFENSVEMMEVDAGS